MKKRSASAEPAVIDTSALIALTDGEAGAEEVVAALDNPASIIPWIALLELHYVTSRRHGLPTADLRYAMLTQVPASVHWEVSEALVHTASRFKSGHRISLADALVAAHAKLAGLRVMHKGPHFEALGVPTHPLPPKTGGA